jgi:aspartate aminotransferase-like enzyme
MGRVRFPSRRVSRLPSGPRLALPQLHSPGLSDLSPDVRRAVATQVVDPRGPEFAALYQRLTARLAAIIGTAEEVIPLTGNGSAAMEAAVINLLSPGDRAVIIRQGVFGDRFAEICIAFGIEVVVLDLDWDRPADPDAVAAAVARVPDARAVLFAAVESSLGVTNDVAAIAAAVRNRCPNVLLVVDAVPSLGAHAMAFDEWGLDAVIGAANKALAGPPGLAFIAVSPRAWTVAEATTTPRYTLDLRPLRALHHQGQMRFTPPVNLVRGVDAALAAIEAVGSDAWIDRHAEAARVARRAFIANGLRPVVDEDAAAHTVTVVELPAGFDAGRVVARARSARGVVVGQGRGPCWADRAVRLGHLGLVSPRRVTRGVHAIVAAVAAERGV